jgi:hypothetical protein
MQCNCVLAALQFASTELCSVRLYCSDLEHRIRAMRFDNYASESPLLCEYKSVFLCVILCCAMPCCVCVASCCYVLFVVFYCDVLCLTVVCYAFCVLICCV